MQNSYTLAQMEAAINYWRTRSPSQGEEMRLCPQAGALAEPYALMIFNGQPAIELSALPPAARQALEDWHQALGHA
ncbi:hypothetical protein ECAE60S_03252 [Eoetvoesiella caeni]|uniref:Uncharacterized protein DUF3717 n=2 Tax=Eoetvoesiella caeni TaxID=645616 RepID=A0A366H2L8_9BURK|nr:DUF3717 domain-containing protein [Eoetvoesiella caeni]MCI2808365.1 DUF3717 domain-containing protein [Eoetvoesiella caeni]NYT53632.1 DUF3717 domain-containing protein [Eoetvoesiella caeni]RBP36036.1 uncharacterized protein DUF3717 [Eoetvoesiella caeni]